MIKLHEGGAYLLHGTEIVADTQDAAAYLESRLGGQAPAKEEAAKGTIAHSRSIDKRIAISFFIVFTFQNRFSNMTYCNRYC